MMDAFRRWCEKILRIPPEPEPPPGDEATARTFRAAPAYFRLLLVMWAIRNVFLTVFLMAWVGVGGTIAIAALHGKRGSGVLVVLLCLVLAFIIFALVFQAVFRLAVLRLEFERRWYVVTDRSLRIREGVVTVREMT